MSTCPTGCGRGVAPGNLMCRRCWHQLAPELQADVWRTWRTLQKEMTAQATADYRDVGLYTRARVAYDAAASAAIAAVKERITQRELAL